MDKKNLLVKEMEVAYEKGFPDRYFDKKYIASDSTVAFVSFINGILDDWCHILGNYTHYNMDHLYDILSIDAMGAYELFGPTVGKLEKAIGKRYLSMAQEIIVGIYVTGEMLRDYDFDNEVVLYNIHRKMK